MNEYEQLQQKIKTGEVWEEFYQVTQSYEFTDGKTWFNRYGQQLRAPGEYNSSNNESWTPFGDE